MSNPKTISGPKTVGSKNFDPDAFFAQWARSEIGPPSDDTNDLQSAIVRAFSLGADDSYAYHAIATVKLPHVQTAIDRGSKGGLHAWYAKEGAGADENNTDKDKSENKEHAPPPKADIEAYTQIFSPFTSTAKALTALASNAKKNSVRAAVAKNLLAKRTVPATAEVAKAKPPAPSAASGSASAAETVDPSYDIWAWTCRCLEWAGPTASTVLVDQSHHVLPVLYHHFGCVAPSYEALMMIKDLALRPTSSVSATATSSSNESSSKSKSKKAAPRQPRTILDIGSGNGYWTYVLRRHNLTVIPVDNGASLWRTTWVGDTIRADGAAYLARRRRDRKAAGGAHGDGGDDAILLLVYPLVSDDFFAKTLGAYAGTTLVVAGTQNANGFTAFQGETVAEWMRREKSGDGWELVLQTPLPSFAGKDEALFVFERRVQEVVS